MVQALVLLMTRPTARARAADVLEDRRGHIEGVSELDQASGEVHVLVPKPVALVPSLHLLERRASDQQTRTGGLAICLGGGNLVERAPQVLARPGVARPGTLNPGQPCGESQEPRQRAGLVGVLGALGPRVHQPATGACRERVVPQRFIQMTDRTVDGKYVVVEEQHELRCPKLGSAIERIRESAVTLEHDDTDIREALRERPGGVVGGRIVDDDGLRDGRIVEALQAAQHQLPGIEGRYDHIYGAHAPMVSQRGRQPLHRQACSWSRVPSRGRTQARCVHARRRNPPPDALPRGALSMPARRLLVVTYYHPPDPTGGHRWAAMGHWLRSLGHEVTTITTNAWGTLDDDLATDTHRTGDLMASPLLRRVLRRPPLASGTDSQTAVAKPPLAVIPRVVVPDVGLVTWLPAAFTVARRLVHERQIDCVVTTGPMHSTHLLGPMLGRKRPAWIADFRDGWCYEPLRPPWPTSAQARLDAAMERRVVRGADAMIGVTRPIAEDLSERLGVTATHIPNGWDPRRDASRSLASPVELEPDTINVVHTGALGGDLWRDPEPLFTAMHWIAVNSPDAARRLRLVLAGPLDARLGELLDNANSKGVRYVGQLSREGSLSLQRSADALLLLTSPHHISHATGKLFEYLAAEKPIIALARGNEAARIVKETGTGVAVAPDDPETIARALLAAVDGTLNAAYAPRDRDRYVYPAPAEAVAELVERAIERRRRH